MPFITDIAIGTTREYMTDDQRLMGRRPDVLAYQTDVLTDDITLAGPILANLWISTSATASDWIVKVIDVFPDDTPESESASGDFEMGGYQMMVRSEVIRGRFRNSYEHPEHFEPNQITQVALELQDLLHNSHRVYHSAANPTHLKVGVLK